MKENLAFKRSSEENVQYFSYRKIFRIVIISLVFSFFVFLSIRLLISLTRIID